MQKILMKYPFHVWLIALYFPFVFFTLNIQHLFISYFIRAEVVSLIVAGLFILVTKLVTKDYSISAIYFSLILLTFYSYPSINYLVGDSVVQLSNQLNIHSTVIWAAISIAFLLLEGLVAIKLCKKYSLFLNILQAGLNITSIVMVVFIVTAFIVKSKYLMDIPAFSAEWEQKVSTIDYQCNAVQAEKPDIYMIILDGYGSSEVLDTIYGYDNSGFEKSLTELGFQIIPNGKTNYSQTRTSVSSMLNMDYLENLYGDIDPEAVDTRPFLYMIKDNKVGRFLRNMGYEIVNLPSGYEYTENLNSDHEYKQTVYFNNFDETILSSSLFSPFLNDPFYQIQANHIKYQLEKLENITDPSPKFVFTHIYAPHPPFVYTKDGKVFIPDYFYSEVDSDTLLTVVTPEYYRDHYSQQVEFISNSIYQTVSTILANSDSNPIIIISGDHGPGLTVSQADLSISNHYERLHIFNAIYVMGEKGSLFPEDHTPVNTFRILFDDVFGCNFKQLPNKSYASTYNMPYKFIDVTELSDINLSKSK